MFELMVKEWIIAKTEETAKRYNCFIDCKRNDDGTRCVEDGYLTVFVEEKSAETEKAIEVRLSTGSVLGSYKGWKVWIPKSQIK